MAAKKAPREEEECEREDARAQDNEEAHVCEEEEKLTVEQSLCEVGGSSKGNAPW